MGFQKPVFFVMLNDPFMGGQDAHPTIKLTLCGTGILPILEKGVICGKGILPVLKKGVICGTGILPVLENGVKYSILPRIQKQVRACKQAYQIAFQFPGEKSH